MNILKDHLDQVAGGTASYDAGHAVGDAARTAYDAFVKAGSLYTPTL